MTTTWRRASTRTGRIHYVRVSTLTGFTMTACGTILRGTLESHDIGPTCRVCRGLAIHNPATYAGSAS